MKATHQPAGNAMAGRPSAEPWARRARMLPLSLSLAALGIVAAGACSKSSPPAVSQTSSALGQSVLGTAQTFAVLAGSTVTNTGATTVDGNLGVDPGLAVTGFPPGLVTGGSIHAGDAVALQAQNDTTTAYDALAGEAVTEDLTGRDLGGMTLVAGVYHFSSSAQLTGTLTLDPQGDPNAAFVFQVGSTLTTASNSSVVVLGGVSDCNIFWQVGSSATLGTTTSFKGSILALTSITLTTGATVSGRALARNAAVTMDTNHVFASTCASSDAGVDASIVRESGPDTSLDVDSSSGGGDDSSVDSSTDSGASNEGSGSSSGSGDSSSSEASAGAETGVGGADAGEAGSNLPCCGGLLCGASCVNTSADDANCGSCGFACAKDESCVGGLCQACTPVCGGVCTDLASDHANCGSCGHACLASAVCTNGACVACSTLCGGACADLAWDHPNCGSCGHACLVSEVCFNGVCQTCPTLCSGACTDLTTDQRNCGSCGTQCAPGDSCVGGACVCQ